MAHKKQTGKKQPSPAFLQKASKAVLAGKCNLSKPTYLKLKKHRNILRKLASMKGSTKLKKAYVTRHKKQVGGLLPLLPVILSAIGSLAGPIIKSI